MLSEHDEIEAKLAADHVSIRDFNQFVFGGGDYTVERYEHVESPDYYYKSGANVVRLRQQPHELTVKRRKSEGSTRDRREIDLRFSHRTGPEDVEAFLRETGFAEALTLVKEAQIFWVRLSRKLTATFVIYDAWREDDPSKRRRFIEIEAEKGSQVTPETAKRYVSAWVKRFQDRFSLGEPLNDSLWEIFSGERYQVIAG